MTEQIGATRVLELLERVVGKYGRDTVRSCKYVIRDDNDVLIPWCIVGCVFAEAGVSPDFLEGRYSNILALWDQESVLDDVVDLSNHAVSILRAAQLVQDSGAPWSKALAEARRRAWALGVHGKNAPPLPALP